MQIQLARCFVTFFESFSVHVNMALEQHEDYNAAADNEGKDDLAVRASLTNPKSWRQSYRYVCMHACCELCQPFQQCQDHAFTLFCTLVYSYLKKKLRELDSSLECGERCAGDLDALANAFASTSHALRVRSPTSMVQPVAAFGLFSHVDIVPVLLGCVVGRKN